MGAEIDSVEVSLLPSVDTGAQRGVVAVMRYSTVSNYLARR